MEARVGSLFTHTLEEVESFDVYLDLTAMVLAVVAL